MNKDSARVPMPATAKASRLGLAVVLLMPMSAWAYIDPGAGMLVWQAVIAAIGAAVTFWRAPREALRRWWQRMRGK